MGTHKCPYPYGASITLMHSHLQSFFTPPPRVAVRRRVVIRHADGRGWEKMENVEFRNFLSITSRKSYCISKIIIFGTFSRWLTCDYSPRNNTMSHLLPAVIWWPSSRCICRCLLIGGKLNSIKFLWRYLMSWIKVNDTYSCVHCWFVGQFEFYGHLQPKIRIYFNFSFAAQLKSSWVRGEICASGRRSPNRLAQSNA